MTTYANIVRVELPENEDEISKDEDENVEPVGEYVMSPKEKYMLENDLILYDFNNEMKTVWNDKGFLNTLRHMQVHKIIDNCMTVTEIEEEEIEESDEEYETDNYE